MGKIIAYFHYYRSLRPEDQANEQDALKMNIRKLNNCKKFLSIKKNFYSELENVKKYNETAPSSMAKSVKFTVYANSLKKVDNESFATIEKDEKQKSNQKQFQWNEESIINLINKVEEKYGCSSPFGRDLTRACSHKGKTIK